MARHNQPRSPHVQIYRPQLTSVLSFTHRMTGVGLCIGAPLLVYWLIAAAAGPQAYSSLHGFLASWLGLVLLLGWSFCLFFHLCNGVRHLFWDAGYGFKLQAIYASGWAVVAMSMALTLVAWIIGLNVKG